MYHVRGHEKHLRENLKGKKRLGEKCVDGRIILKWM
jgi:hypothetical protein